MCQSRGSTAEREIHVEGKLIKGGLIRAINDPAGSCCRLNWTSELVELDHDIDPACRVSVHVDVTSWM
jgi:hypothetical protein